MGFPIEDIIHLGQGKNEFVFATSEELWAACKDFKMLRVMVEPNKLFENLRRLKSPLN